MLNLHPPQSLLCVCLLMALCSPLFAQRTRPATDAWKNWASTNPSSPVAEGAKLQLLSGEFKFTEGPTSDEKGNIFFVDQDNNRIMEWSADGKLSTYMQPSSYSNGMCFDNQGNIISCADELNQLWSIAPDKKVTVLIEKYNGKFMNGPNDVWVHPNGSMYITDPLYPRSWWKHRTPAMQMETQGVYYLAPDRTTLKLLLTDYQQPNGIIGTPDGKMLYVSDIRAGHTYSYNIQPDGSLTDKKLFNNFGSDGMTIDSDGNVYTTSRGAVQISDKNGKLLDRIPANGANCCFGGADGHMLFITARTQVFGLQMKTHRVGPQ